jgi:hypothetical protein
MVADFLKPAIIEWIYKLSSHAVVLASIWVVGRKYLS